MAYHSTGIANIEDYFMMPSDMVMMMKVTDVLRHLFNLSLVRSFAKWGMKGGSTAEERAQTQMHVWGEVVDEQGRKAVSRLRGPEGGVIWTAHAALGAVRKVLANEVKPGFQTPSLAYGPDFVLECEGVTRQDLPSD